jgi:hypothetical protein
VVAGASGVYGGCGTVYGVDGLRTGGGNGVGGGTYCACAWARPLMTQTTNKIADPLAKSRGKVCRSHVLPDIVASFATMFSLDN